MRLKNRIGVRATVLAIIAVAALVLTAAAQAHSLSGTTANAVAKRIAKTEARAIANHLTQSVGGDWYPSGWVSRRCTVRSGYGHRHSARCQITAGAISPQHGPAKCVFELRLTLRSASSQIKATVVDSRCDD